MGFRKETFGSPSFFVICDFEQKALILDNNQGINARLIFVQGNRIKRHQELHCSIQPN